MIAETASPASSIVRNAARCVVTASGLRRMRSVISVAMPSVPSEPMKVPSRSGPSASSALPPSSTISAVRQYHRQTRDVIHGEAVLEAMRAAGVLRHVAADRADLLARRIGCVEEPVRSDGLADVEVRDSRLDDDALRCQVDFENPVHARQRDDDALRDGKRAARESRPRAARDERHALAGADLHGRLYLGRRAGQHDELGHRAPAGQAVAIVDAKLLGLGDHIARADGVLQLGPNGGWERHRSESTQRRKGGESMIDYRGFALRSV